MTGRAELDHRLGDAERRAVVDALGTHREAGRLTPEEVEDRQFAVASAQTWSDVAPLFADLPAPYPAGMPRTVRNAVTGSASDGWGLRDGQRNAVMTVVTLGATAAFFYNGSWLTFLAIPAAGALLHWNDPDDKPARSKRSRRHGGD